MLVITKEALCKIGTVDHVEIKNHQYVIHRIRNINEKLITAMLQATDHVGAEILDHKYVKILKIKVIADWEIGQYEPDDVINTPTIQDEFEFLENAIVFGRMYKGREALALKITAQDVLNRLHNKMCAETVNCSALKY